MERITKEGWARGAGGQAVHSLRPGCALVSYCYCNKSPQFFWLKTIEMYRLMILEVRSLKWVGRSVFLLEARGKNPFLAFSIFWRLPAFLGSGPCVSPTFAGVITSPLILTLLPPPFPSKDPCDDTGPAQIIHGNIFTPKSSTSSYLGSSFGHVR